jgi:hypothetical protein
MEVMGERRGRRIPSRGIVTIIGQQRQGEGCRNSAYACQSHHLLFAFAPMKKRPDVLLRPHSVGVEDLIISWK